MGDDVGGSFFRARGAKKVASSDLVFSVHMAATQESRCVTPFSPGNAVQSRQVCPKLGSRPKLGRPSNPVRPV
eukprot:5346887-Prymnesium_polylepis.1